MHLAGRPPELVNGRSTYVLYVHLCEKKRRLAARSELIDLEPGEGRTLIIKRVCWKLFQKLVNMHSNIPSEPSPVYYIERAAIRIHLPIIMTISLTPGSTFPNLTNPTHNILGYLPPEPRAQGRYSLPRFSSPRHGKVEFRRKWRMSREILHTYIDYGVEACRMPRSG